jgi:hypothetical protein
MGPHRTAAGEALTFLGRPLPPSFELLAVTLPPGARRDFRELEWRDAIVVVERGAIELECTRGGVRRFGRGAVLALDGLPLAAVRNAGEEPVLLIAVSRRGPDDG